MDISILFEDQDLLVVNKPSGLIVHEDGRSKAHSLVDWIAQQFPNLESVGEEIMLDRNITIKRFGVVHRIDKETSGVVLVAKNQETYEFLKAQFVNREIEKFYHAVVYGDVRYDEGLINLPIGRDKNDFRKRATGRAVRGELKEALTYYKVLARKDRMSFVEANPKTGRTHQIRVHFANTGHPILGDRLYSVYRKTPIDIGRLALHAYSIEFTLPNGKLHKVTAPYPEEFIKAVEFFGLA